MNSRKSCSEAKRVLEELEFWKKISRKEAQKAQKEILAQRRKAAKEDKERKEIILAAWRLE